MVALVDAAAVLPNGPRCDASFASEFKLVLQKSIETFVIHYQHYIVGFLFHLFKGDTSARHILKWRRTPASAVSPHCYTVSALSRR